MDRHTVLSQTLQRWPLRRGVHPLICQNTNGYATLFGKKTEGIRKFFVAEIKHRHVHAFPGLAQSIENQRNGFAAGGEGDAGLTKVGDGQGGGAKRENQEQEKREKPIRGATSEVSMRLASGVWRLEIIAGNLCRSHRKVK
jgi:hypothetical protein